MSSWLEDGDSGSEWLQVMDWDGSMVGWLRRRDAHMLRMPIHLIETPDRYLKDVMVKYHSDLAYERGIFSKGQDLNDVQIVLLASHLIRKREAEAKMKVATFEADLFISDKGRYDDWMERKKQADELTDEMVQVEQRVPTDIEQFLADIASFSEEDPANDGKEQRVEGWLSSLLSDEDLQGMSDE